MNDFNPPRSAPPPVTPPVAPSVYPSRPPLIVAPPPATPGHSSVLPPPSLRLPVPQPTIASESVALPRPSDAQSQVWSTPKKPLRKPGLWPWNKRVVPAAKELMEPELPDKQQMPAWLVSFIVHLTLLVVLALIPLTRIIDGPMTFYFGDSAGEGEGVEEFDLDSAASPTDSIDPTPEVVEPTQVVNTNALLENIKLPEISPLPSTTSAATAAVSESLKSLPSGISKGLSGRGGNLRGDLIKRFGGTGQTIEAVELGLQWLAKNQMSDGSWSLVGPYEDGGANENRTAATALALNAFLGDGNTPADGKYKENVRLGLAYLVKRQDEDGFFAGREPSRQQMYAQAIATITICEAYGMTGDSKFRIAAQKALKFAEWSQSKLKGWRYDPRIDADLSVSGWFLMAFVTGKMVELEVDEEIFRSVGNFLDSVQHDEGSRYAYKEFDPPSLSMTAEGLLCRIYLGWPRTEPAMMRAIRDDLLPNKPRRDEEMSSVYYWYYATQVLHHIGGRDWEEWNAAMKKVLPAAQVRGGKEAGSWGPDKDQFGTSGGRLYTTCLNMYCLEVYYRHLAMYDLDHTKRK